jgi:hypothetical protein
MSGWQANPVAYGLRRNGERIRLARQPMDLLLLLLERPQELVSRDEIATRLWAKDVFVDLDAGIHTAVLRIRQALGDPANCRDSWRPWPVRATGSSRLSTSYRRRVATRHTHCQRPPTRGVITCRPISRALLDATKNSSICPGRSVLQRH